MNYLAVHLSGFEGQAEQQSLCLSNSTSGQMLLSDNALSHASDGPSLPSLEDFYPGCFSGSEPASFANKDRFSVLEGILERAAQQSAQSLGGTELQAFTECAQLLDPMAGQEEAQLHQGPVQHSDWGQAQQERGQGGAQRERQDQDAVAVALGSFQQLLEFVPFRESGNSPQMRTLVRRRKHSKVGSGCRSTAPYQQRAQVFPADSARIRGPVEDQCQQVLSTYGGDLINRPLRLLVTGLVLRAMGEAREQITIQQCFFQCPSSIGSKIEFAGLLHWESNRLVSLLVIARLNDWQRWFSL
jgi:hypothetical protein